MLHAIQSTAPSTMSPSTRPPTKGRIINILHFFRKLAVKQFKDILKLNNLNFVILSTAPSTMPPSTKPSTKGKITDYAFVSPWIASKIGVIR